MRPRSRLLPWLVRLALLCAFAMPVLPVRGQTPTPNAPMSLDEYRAELVNAIATLEAAPEAGGSEGIDKVIDALQQHFAEITQVEYRASETVHLTSILDDLDALRDESSSAGDENADAPTPRTAALARLKGAVAQIDAMPQDNTAARLALLAEVLARPEFNTPMTLWDRFWQWLRNFLTRWLPDQESANAGWVQWLIEIVPWIVTLAIAVAVIWLLTYWLQRILRNFVADARLTEIDIEDDLPNSAAEARQQARTAAQSGNYRDAVRRLYLAALLQLAEHDLIRYERSLTNREVLVRVPADSPIRAHLEPVVATFDRVWYGMREPDSATFHAYEQEIDELASVAARAAAALRRGDD